LKVARGEDPGHLGPDPEELVLMEAPAGRPIVYVTVDRKPRFTHSFLQRIAHLWP